MAILNYATSISELIDGMIDVGGFTSPATSMSTEVQEGILIKGTQYDPLYSLDFASKSKVWVSCHSKATNSGKLGTLMGLYGVNGTPLMSLDVISEESNPLMAIVVYDTEGVGTQVFTDNSISTFTALTRTDILWDAETGVVEVYKDYFLVYSYSTDLSSHEQATNFRIGSCVGANAFGEQYSTYYSALFICEQDSRPIKMYQHEVASAGSVNEFTGSVTDLNSFGGIGLGDGMSYHDQTAKQTFLIGSIPSTQGNILAVGISSRGGAPIEVSSGFKHTMGDGTNDAESDVYYYNTGEDMTARKTLFTTKQDGSAITIEDLTTIEFGIEGV